MHLHSWAWPMNEGRSNEFQQRRSRRASPRPTRVQSSSTGDEQKRTFSRPREWCFSQVIRRFRSNLRVPLTSAITPLTSLELSGGACFCGAQQQILSPSPQLEIFTFHLSRSKLHPFFLFLIASIAWTEPLNRSWEASEDLR